MNELAAILRKAGVVGAGGAGFPTYAKLSAEVDFLVANGAECEPLLNKDQVLMTNYPEIVLDGMGQMMGAINAKKGIIAIKSKHHESISALNQKLSSTKLPVEVSQIPDIYPAGDEVVLIYETLKRVVPPGALPATVGSLVDNIETLLNVSLAVQGEPVTAKYVTVTGWVNHPVTLKLPVGAPLSKALELAGGPSVRDFAVILNGLMMGTPVTDLDLPVTKTTSALLVLPSYHPVVLSKQKKLENMIKIARSACTSCSHCSETCPRRLLGHPVQPHLVMRAVGYFSLPDGTSENSLPEICEKARYCVGCGVCDLICPMGLSPRSINTYIKNLLPKKSFTPGNGNVVPLESREGLRFPAGRVNIKLGITELINIHPPLREIIPDEIPKVRLVLKQGIGVAAVPVTKEGQMVKKGELVAEPPDGQLGAALHSSIGGKVTVVTSQEIVVEKAGR